MRHFKSATAATAAVIVSCVGKSIAAATAAVVAATAEENEDDEKEPAVIASATHDVTPFLFCEVGLISQPLTFSSYDSAENVLQKFKKEHRLMLLFVVYLLKYWGRNSL